MPAPGLKSAVPWNSPVLYTLPKASTAIEYPRSADTPPKFFAQTKFPDAFNLRMKTSAPTIEVRLTTPGPGPKSVVVPHYPEVYTFPEGSTVIE